MVEATPKPLYDDVIKSNAHTLYWRILIIIIFLIIEFILKRVHRLAARVVFSFGIAKLFGMQQLVFNHSQTIFILHFKSFQKDAVTKIYIGIPIPISASTSHFLMSLIYSVGSNGHSLLES